MLFIYTITLYIYAHIVHKLSFKSSDSFFITDCYRCVNNSGEAKKWIVVQWGKSLLLCYRRCVTSRIQHDSLSYISTGAED